MPGTMAAVVGSWPVDDADGLRPPPPPTGPSTPGGSSTCLMLDIIVPAFPRTNRCPEKPDAAGAASTAQGQRHRQRRWPRGGQ